jgi:hypothetical protein
MTQCRLDFSVPSLFSVSSVLKLLTFVLPPKNLNTEYTEKYEDTEKEDAVRG